MMTERANQVPGLNDPDPETQRLRPFQGGSDSLPPMLDQAPDRVTDEQSKGAGKSGLPPLPQSRPPVARTEA